MHRRRFVASVAVTVVVSLVAMLGGVADARPAVDPGTAAPTDATAEQPGAIDPTPVLSMRRLPGLLAGRKADADLRVVLEPILAQVTPTTCLTVRSSGRPVSETNPQLPVMPASTEKILTATGVLHRLGGDGTVTTDAVTAAPPSNGVIAGDLYVVGAGDPLLATAGYLSTFDEPDDPYNDYAKLADAIKAAGITRIEGSIIGDESHFDAQRYLPSWPSRYISKSEVGPLGALMVNDGFTGLTKTPDVPATDRHPGEPAALAADTLTSLLEQRGVHVTGPAGAGTAPSGATTVASLASQPMSVNVGEMLRSSDNTTAEVLLKDLGSLDGGQGTTPGGAQVLHDTLEQLGLPTEGAVTIDGSGLDLGNRVTCDLLVSALDRLGPISTLAAALPIAGQTGTLRKRMRGTAAEGKIHAKTGTLNEVSALAGFADAASGEHLTFAFIINGVSPTALTLGDQLGVALAQYGAGIPLDQLGPRSAGT